MPQVIRTAIVLCALAAAALPAWAQTSGGGGGSGAGGSAAGGAFGGSALGTPGASGLADPSSGLLRPGTVRPPPMPETYRRDPPPAAPQPWSAQPAPGAKPPLSGGIMSEQQARDRITAAGYTNVRTLRPTYSGSWTGQATQRGSPVRVTIDPRGTISADHSDRYR